MVLRAPNSGLCSYFISLTSLLRFCSSATVLLRAPTMQSRSQQARHDIHVWLLQNSELTCLRVLVATVLALTAVIFGAEVFVERRIAVDSHIDPGAGMKKKKATLSDALAVRAETTTSAAIGLRAAQ